MPPPSDRGGGGASWRRSRGCGTCCQAPAAAASLFSRSPWRTASRPRSLYSSCDGQGLHTRGDGSERAAAGELRERHEEDVDGAVATLGSGRCGRARSPAGYAAAHGWASGRRGPRARPGRRGSRRATAARRRGWCLRVAWVCGGGAGSSWRAARDPSRLVTIKQLQKVRTYL